MGGGHTPCVRPMKRSAPRTSRSKVPGPASARGCDVQADRRNSPELFRRPRTRRNGPESRPRRHKDRRRRVDDRRAWADPPPISRRACRNSEERQRSSPLSRRMQWAIFASTNSETMVSEPTTCAAVTGEFRTSLAIYESRLEDHQTVLYRNCGCRFPGHDRRYRSRRSDTVRRLDHGRHGLCRRTLAQAPRSMPSKGPGRWTCPLSSTSTIAPIPGRRPKSPQKFCRVRVDWPR